VEESRVEEIEHPQLERVLRCIEGLLDDSKSTKDRF